jgi:hypothetical protein
MARRIKDAIVGLRPQAVRRSDLVREVREAKAIVDEAVPRGPVRPGDTADDNTALRAVAFGMVLRELLDNETEP